MMLDGLMERLMDCLFGSKEWILFAFEKGGYFICVCDFG